MQMTIENNLSAKEMLFYMVSILRAIQIDMGNVKFVPGLATNSISVSCLTRKGFTASFDKNKCRINDRNGIVVLVRFYSGGLYHLK